VAFSLSLSLLLVSLCLPEATVFTDNVSIIFLIGIFRIAPPLGLHFKQEKRFVIKSLTTASQCEHNHDGLLVCVEILRTDNGLSIIIVEGRSMKYLH
jgi:hypothetical protein